AVVYTDIAKDGMMSGPNFDALAEMQAAVPLPVIASGGVCSLEHVRRLMAGGIPGWTHGRAACGGEMDLGGTDNPAAQRQALRAPPLTRRPGRHSTARAHASCRTVGPADRFGRPNRGHLSHGPDPSAGRVHTSVF